MLMFASTVVAAVSGFLSLLLGTSAVAGQPVKVVHRQLALAGVAALVGSTNLLFLPDWTEESISVSQQAFYGASLAAALFGAMALIVVVGNAVHIPRPRFRG